MVLTMLVNGVKGKEQDCCEAQFESLVEAPAFEPLAVNQGGRVLDAIQFKSSPLTTSHYSQLQKKPHSSLVEKGKKNK